MKQRSVVSVARTVEPQTSEYAPVWMALLALGAALLAHAEISLESSVLSAPSAAVGQLRPQTPERLAHLAPTGVKG
jgi:hypothetical protein